MQNRDLPDRRDTVERHGAEREPAAPRGTVARRKLFALLSSAPAGGVILVCAPAGSGKTVLVRSWLHDAGLAGRAAWVPVERGERDGQRFWLSVIGALADVAGDEVVTRVSPSPEFRGRAVIDRLLAGLRSLEEPTVLVIDDLHELGSAKALGCLERFVAGRPQALRVVLVTREDPRLGLHRLRLAGELTELRDPDMAFSLEETRELLAKAGVALSDAGVTLLQERTEGWAAGLRLAAISLARHPDPERFVKEFSGSERTVAGYLLAEVLERQPAEVREMLLRTSVLERVSGPLADFLTGGSGSERILQRLEDASAFVTSLDAGRSWFRYHHLFAELLQLELRRAAPAIMGSLHRAAARWHEQDGYVVEAIRHAQAAHDWPHASRLLADNHFELTFDGRTATVRELLGAFPEDVAAADAELALVCSGVRLLAGQREESASYVDLADGLAGVISADRRGRFDVQLAEMRLVVARWRGDLQTVLESMRSLEAALAALPSSERALSHAHRAVALQNLGIAELWSSRPDDARRDLEQALGLARQAGRPWLQIACLGHLGIVGPTGLPVSAGLQHSEDAVRIAEEHGWDSDPVIVTGLATGAIALLCLGRFDEAEGWIARAQHVLQPDGEPGIELIVHHARGLLHLGQRRFSEALAAFRAAERMQGLLADEHPFAVPTRARLLQAQVRLGQAAAARAALAELGEQERNRAGMRITVAAIHLTEGRPEQAIDVLAPVIEGPATALQGLSAAIEALLYEAAARHQLGDPCAAEASLERSLELAEPEGIILPFTLAPVQDLLERHPRHRTTHATLLSAIRDLLAGTSPQPRGRVAPLLEQLSDAELRVLRYLPGNMTASEIAAELCVSRHTTRTHLRHIYAKLDAHTRTEAVARARQLGLLAPSRHR
ncbi:MAG TPA: LuxR C-terminal-related transcriptional regulator [Gemmatimonadales bacterium]|nr:LuxR C-terminal-related transcriptional regulator [Gemmatimonadales bacterium]